MGTSRQDEANRRNGQRGKGRKTAEGKAISARNSLKHGLLSREVLLPNEDGAAFSTFCEGLRTELNPGGELESLLAERIIGLAWRLRRLGKIEAGILTWRYYEIQIKRSRQKSTKHSFENKLSREIEEHNLQPAEREERARALAEHKEQQSAQESDLATCGEAFIVDSGKENALAKLSRYETSMTRSLFRTLHELQRLQAARKGKDVPVPFAVDIDVSGAGALVIDDTVFDQGSNAG
jgi:hypothetical protein